MQWMHTISWYSNSLSKPLINSSSHNIVSGENQMHSHIIGFSCTSFHLKDWVNDNFFFVLGPPTFANFFFPSKGSSTFFFPSEDDSSQAIQGRKVLDINPQLCKAPASFSSSRWAGFFTTFWGSSELSWESPLPWITWFENLGVTTLDSDPACDTSVSFQAIKCI